MHSPDEPRDRPFDRWWRLAPAVLAAVVALVAAGVVLARPAGYEAESRVLVGTFEAESSQIAGYVLATETMARNYDRLATSGAVLEPLSERLDVPIAVLRERLSVSAVPESSVIRVVASAGDPQEARRMSEATAEEIVASVTSMAADTGVDDLLIRHRQAAADLAEADLERSKLETSLGELRADPDAAAAEIEATTRDLRDAQASVSEARLRADGIATRYLEEQRQATTAGDARVLGAALVSEESPFLDVLLALAIGAAAGWLAGHAIAAIAARRGRGRTGPPARGPHERGQANGAGSERPLVASR